MNAGTSVNTSQSIQAGYSRLLGLCVDWSSVIDRLADNVDNAAKAFRADGNHDGCAGVDDFHATNETFRTC